MNNFLKPLFDSDKHIYILSIAASLILFSTYLYNDDILNDDGINYIYAAYEYANGNIEKANTYRNETLFFSQFSILSNITGLSVKHSAFVLSALAQLILGCGLLAITRSLGGSKTTQLLIILVFSSISSFNELRPHILRGFAYWACQLWAIWALINYIQLKKIRFVLLWFFLSVFSITYRTEAVAYLFLIPFLSIFILDFSARAKLIFLFLALFVLAGTSGAVFFIIQNNYLPEFLPSYSKKINMEIGFIVNIQNTFENLKDGLENIMPNKWARNSSNDILIGGLLFHLLKTFILTTGIPIFLLAIYQISRYEFWWNTPTKRLLNMYFSIGIFIGFLVVFTRYFVGERYIMVSAILCCLPAANLLKEMVSGLAQGDLSNNSLKPKSFKRITYSAIIILLFSSMLYPLLTNDHKKRYISEAGYWIKNNIDDNKNVFINEQKIAFYTDNFQNDTFNQAVPTISELQQNYHFFVLYSDPKLLLTENEESLRKTLAPFKIKEFIGHKGRNIIIYEISDTLT